jgi:hypothetical protein
MAAILVAKSSTGQQHHCGRRDARHRLGGSGSRRELSHREGEADAQCGVTAAPAGRARDASRPTGKARERGNRNPDLPSLPGSGGRCFR